MAKDAAVEATLREIQQMKLDILSLDRRKDNLRVEHKKLVDQNNTLNKEYESLKKEKQQIERERVRKMQQEQISQVRTGAE